MAAFSPSRCHFGQAEEEIGKHLKDSTYPKEIRLTQKLSLILSLPRKYMLSDLLSPHHPISPSEETAPSEPEHSYREECCFFYLSVQLNPLHLVLSIPEGMLCTLSGSHGIQILLVSVSLMLLCIEKDYSEVTFKNEYLIH